MPELPEVEVSRLGITPWMVGERIENIIVREKRLRWPVPDDIHFAVGMKIHQVTRRAKYLLIHVDAGNIVIHLGMSGKLRVIDASVPAVKHDHIDIVLGSGIRLSHHYLVIPGQQLVDVGIIEAKPTIFKSNKRVIIVVRIKRKHPSFRLSCQPHNGYQRLSRR